MCEVKVVTRKRMGACNVGGSRGRGVPGTAMADQTCQSYMLPCHASCLVEDRFSVCEEYVDRAEIPQWALITTLLNLQRPVDSISSLEDLLSCIQYDLQFTTLRSTLQGICAKNPNFFDHVWPNMVAAALSLPRLFPDGELRALQQQIDASISLSREQIASLLVHMFLCSLRPPKWSKFWANFGIWYNSDSPPVQAYLHCLFDYFTELDQSGKPPHPLETVEFHRQVLQQPPNWSTSTAQFYDGILVTSVSLEPEPDCHVEVSFANRDIGFGVSGTQEEVKMAMSPEACVAMLITPTLLENETLLIRGARQVGSCQGIGRKVSYCGPLEPDRYQDYRDWKERWIITMDAMELDNLEENSDSQPATAKCVIQELKRSVLERDLNKAFCGFSGVQPHVQQCGDGSMGGATCVSIATGHWGCGAFGGHKQAKAIIQLMVAAEAGKALVYHDVDGEGDELTPFLQELEAFVSLLVETKATVAQLYSAMLKVGDKCFTDNEPNLLKICCTILTDNY